MDLDYVSRRLLLAEEPIYPTLPVGPTLDGRATSDLKWDLDHVPEGPLLWNLELGFPCDLEDEAHFQTLALSVTHFVDTVYTQFKDRTYGVILYQGEIALEDPDPLVKYLELLSIQLPAECPAFVLLKGATWELASHDRWERLVLATESLEGLDRGALWDGQSIRFFEKQELPAALYLPACNEAWDKGACEQGFAQIREAEKEFRVIAEPHLHMEWSGLDRLYILPESMSRQGQRQVDGFVAAGGEVVEVSV